MRVKRDSGLTASGRKGGALKDEDGTLFGEVPRTDLLDQWLSTLAVDVILARGGYPDKGSVTAVLDDSFVAAYHKATVRATEADPDISELESQHKRFAYKSTYESILSAALSPSGLLCPRCVSGYIVPGTKAAKKYGVCEGCLRRAQAAARRQLAEEVEAGKGWNAARKEHERALTKAAIKEGAKTHVDGL